jgi:hypothetical protein
MSCVVYMGSEDMRRQSANVYRMRLLGAEVRAVESGSRTLKDALNEAMRDWVTNVDDTFYIIGTVAGPHPYPMMVRDFNSVVGKECLVQMPELAGRQPDYVVACVGGGSNAMGIFYDYIDDAPCAWWASRRPARAWTAAGMRPAWSAAPRACCTAIAPTCCRTRTARSAKRTASVPVSITRAWARNTPGSRTAAVPSTWASPMRRHCRPFHDCCRIEGIIPALESSHALAYAAQLAPRLAKDRIVLANLSGRGDKDLHIVADAGSVHPGSAPVMGIVHDAHRRAFCPAAQPGAYRADRLHRRRRPVAGAERAADARTGARRRRFDRAGGAVFGPDGRWAGHPARGRARHPQGRRTAPLPADGCRNFGAPTRTRRWSSWATPIRSSTWVCKAFVAAAAAAGVDGVIVVDYPPEECQEFVAALRQAGLDPIFLLAPTSTDERIDQVARWRADSSTTSASRGSPGPGTWTWMPWRRDCRPSGRAAHFRWPWALASATGASARAVARIADAVVVGSRLVEEMKRPGRRGRWPRRAG